MALEWMGKGPRYRWLYRIDTNGNRIGEKPVGKMYLDMIILDFPELMDHNARFDDAEPGSKWDYGDTFYWQGQNTEDLMYGLEAVGPIIPDQSGFPSLYKQNKEWKEAKRERDKDEEQGWSIKGFDPQGFVKEKLHSKKIGDSNVPVFINLPPSAMLDYDFPYDFPKGSRHKGVNKLELMVYMMDPSSMRSLIAGDLASVKVHHEPVANRIWKKDYNRLLRLWEDTPHFFAAINVEDISR